MIDQMNDWLHVFGALLGGGLLGVLFFGGLWLTIKYAMNTRNTGLWFALSMLLRTAIVIGGFYWISQGHLVAIVACLLGFMLSRLWMVKKINQLKTLADTK